MKLTSDLKLNGFYRVSSSKIVHPLKTYDLETGIQQEVPLPRRNRVRRRKLTPKQIAEIKAHVIESTPIPNILATEYFCGLRPQTTPKEKISRGLKSDQKALKKEIDQE